MDRIFPFKRDRGFSLVEMLAVVVIIGILASIIAAAAQAARRRARIARMRVEIDGLVTAIENYKNELGGGDYPPSNPADAARHLRRAFPLYTGGLSATFSGPDEALHFWLAGPTGDGWSADPLNPFAVGGTRYGPYYEFDEERVNGHKYLPFETSTDGYRYFKAAVDGTYAGGAIQRSGTAGPEWINPRSFQIHGPGLDGVFGSGGLLDDSTGYSDERWDDMNNGCTGTLGDENK